MSEEVSIHRQESMVIGRITWQNRDGYWWISSEHDCFALFFCNGVPKRSHNLATGLPNQPLIPDCCWEITTLVEIRRLQCLRLHFCGMKIILHSVHKTVPQGRDMDWSIARIAWVYSHSSLTLSCCLEMTLSNWLNRESHTRYSTCRQPSEVVELKLKLYCKLASDHDVACFLSCYLQILWSLQQFRFFGQPLFPARRCRDVAMWSDDVTSVVPLVLKTLEQIPLLLFNFPNS